MKKKYNIKQHNKSKRPQKNYFKRKNGSTLIELVAVIAILSIVSTTCLSGMFALTKMAKMGQNISESQRICKLLGEQIMLYACTGSDVVAYEEMPSLNIYDEASQPGGFMDADHGTGPLIDIFISSDQENANTILFQKYNSSNNNLETLVSVDGIKKVDFTVDKLSTATKKFMLRYKITTVYDYEITGGVVLNNTKSSQDISNIVPSGEEAFSIIADPLESGFSEHNSNVLRIRTTSKK